MLREYLVLPHIGHMANIEDSGSYNRLLTDLLDARRTLRATQLDAINARVDHAKATLAWRLRTQTSPTP